MTESSLNTEDIKDTQYVCSISRPFDTENSQFKFKINQAVNWKLGFNIWPKMASTTKTANGVSPLIVLMIVDGATILSQKLVTGVLLTSWILY